MDVNQIERVYDNIVYGNILKKLINTLATNPKRFISPFSPIKSEEEIRTFLGHSSKIKVGNAYEIILKMLFESIGCELIEKKFSVNNKTKIIDQLFKHYDSFIFIEQKMNDDHDSTKKEAIIKDFEEKIKHLIEKYGLNIRAYLYFVTDAVKNKNYYSAEIIKLREKYQIDISVLYGKELFVKENKVELWKLIDNFNKQRQKTKINIDFEGENYFLAIKDININIWLKILNNEEIVKEVLPLIFPSKEVDGVLNLLRLDFKAKYREFYYLSSFVKNHYQAVIKLEEIIGTKTVKTKK